MKCSACGIKEAVIYQRHTGMGLCRDCFINDVITRVRNEVKKFEMFDERHKLMLAVSGGKDSYVLLDVILKLHDPSRVGVVSVVEGIEGYNRTEDLLKVKDVASKHGVDVVVISLKDYVGLNLTEIVNLSRKKGMNISPCTYCGILRRKVINEVARDLGYDRVLTAHNLDDEVQTALLNILRGDIFRLVQLHPKGPLLSPLFVRKVKPLRKIYEEEVAIYAHIIGYEFQTTDCPYLRFQPSLRARLREYLYKLERKNPGTMLKFLNMLDEFLEKHLGRYSSYPELPKCLNCGEATAYGRRYCMACELLMDLGIEKPKYLRIRPTELNVNFNKQFRK